MDRIVRRDNMMSLRLWPERDVGFFALLGLAATYRVQRIHSGRCEIRKHISSSRSNGGGDDDLITRKNKLPLCLFPGQKIATNQRIAEQHRLMWHGK